MRREGQMSKALVLGFIVLLTQPVLANSFEDMVLVNTSSPIYMDIFEVSNNKAAPVFGKRQWGTDKPDRMDQFEADKYCRHMGKRLPTRDEWLSAASNLGVNQSYTLIGDREPSASEINVKKAHGGSASPYDFSKLGIDAIGT